MDRERAVDVQGVARANDNLAAQAPGASIDASQVATREDLLATILAQLLMLPRGRVALVEGRFTNDLLDVLALGDQEHVSSQAPIPEAVDSSLAVTANLMLGDVSAASRENSATRLMGALYMANANGCLITSCCGDPDEDPCSALGAVLVILPSDRQMNDSGVRAREDSQLRVR